MPARTPDDADREKRSTAAMVDRLLSRLPGLNEPEPGMPIRRPPGTPLPPIPKAIVGTGRPRPVPLAVWARTALALGLAVGVTQWPYAAECGWPLLGYTAVLTAVVAAGVWSAVWAWRGQLPLPHILALLAVMVGLVLAADVVLPRTGYAVFDASWTCRAPLP